MKKPFDLQYAIHWWSNSNGSFNGKLYLAILAAKNSKI